VWFGACIPMGMTKIDGMLFVLLARAGSVSARIV
jgi:hypothetical protein